MDDEINSAYDLFLAGMLCKESANFRSNKAFEEWNSLTAKFAGAANIPFMILQLPQIILNARNLLAGNKTALLAVPWLVRKYQEFVIFESNFYKFFLLLRVVPSFHTFISLAAYKTWAKK